jgi:Family of unknown function (DUF5677)
MWKGTPVSKPVQAAEEELYRQLVEHMAIIGERTSKARPTPFVAPPRGPQLVVLLAEWALTLYKGVQLLIARRLPDPTQLLARTLLEDAIRLAYFRLHPEKLEEFAVRWTLEALHEEQALELAARYEFSDAGRFVDDPSAEIAQLKAEAKRSGWSTSTLPEMKDMAKAVERPELYWIFRLYSMRVHTSRLALTSVLGEHDDGTTWLGVPGSLQEAIRVGRASTDALVIAFFSMADLLGWQKQLEELALIGQVNHLAFEQIMDAAGFAELPQQAPDSPNATA